MTNKPKNPLHFFNAATEGGTLVLTVYDTIGESMFGEGITAQSMTDALTANTFDSVTLRISSPGGDAYAGVSIYNVLRSTGKPINVIVDGLAASAASIVAMAGDTVTMLKGSMMMVHPAQAIAIGSAEDMRKMSEVLDAVTDSIADIYVAHTKASKRQVMQWLNAETWMNGKEAIENGFADSVTEEKASAATNSFDLSVFRNAPEELKKKKEGEPFPASAPVVTPTPAPSNPNGEPGSPGSPVVNPVVVDGWDPVIDILRKKLELLRA